MTSKKADASVGASLLAIRASKPMQQHRQQAGSYRALLHATHSGYIALFKARQRGEMFLTTQLRLQFNTTIHRITQAGHSLLKFQGTAPNDPAHLLQSL
jgi:hypothetical protein